MTHCFGKNNVFHSISSFFQEFCLPRVAEVIMLLLGALLLPVQLESLQNRLTDTNFTDKFICLSNRPKPIGASLIGIHPFVFPIELPLGTAWLCEWFPMIELGNAAETKMS